VIAFLFIALAGVARATHTIRKDDPEGNFFTLKALYNIKFAKWYWGGNQFYNPANIFTADFWHFFVFVQTYCWIGAVATAEVSLWWLYLLIGSPVEGWVFVYFYHYAYRGRGGEVWDFLKGRFTFINKHRPKE